MYSVPETLAANPVLVFLRVRNFLPKDPHDTKFPYPQAENNSILISILIEKLYTSVYGSSNLYYSCF